MFAPAGTGGKNTGTGTTMSPDVMKTQYATYTSFVSNNMEQLLGTITDSDNTVSTELSTKLVEFRAFNNGLRKRIAELSKDIDIGERTRLLGELRGRIKKLEKLEATAREETETAQSRLRYVEKREQDVSYKQLFFMDRPVRQMSVPTFVTLSVLLALLTIRFIYMLYSGVEVGEVSTSYLTGIGSATANTGGLAGFFGYGAQAPAAGLGGLFSSSGITGQLR
jgi:hypothetical protein